MNHVVISGYLARDPELKYSTTGKAYTKMTIANGIKGGPTIFIEVMSWDKEAEFCAENLQKGRPVLVEGRLTQTDWKNKEGKKFSKTFITSSKVHILDWPAGSAAHKESEDSAGDDDCDLDGNAPPAKTEEDDLPF
jgi:single-strand DNA-binding protein